MTSSVVATLACVAALLAFVAPQCAHGAGTDECDAKYALCTRVAIVGAGMSGVRAATVLESAGVDDWLLFEGRASFGGRMRPERLGEHTIELGAAWLQGANLDADVGPVSPLMRLAVDCDVKTVAQRFGALEAFNVNGSAVHWRDVPWERLDAADACVVDELLPRMRAGRLRDMSLRTAFQRCGFTPRTPLENALLHFYTTFEWGEDPSITSARASADFPVYRFYGDDDRLLVDRRGFRELVGCLADRHLTRGGRRDERVHYSTPVAKMWTRRGELLLDDGRLVKADYIISSLPIGVLHHDLVENAGRMFAPRLSERRALAQLRYHTAGYSKHYLQFDPDVPRFWDNKQFLLKSSSFGVGPTLVHNLDGKNFKPGSRMIEVTFQGDLAARGEQLSEAEQLEIIMRELRLVYGNDIPAPTRTRFGNWTNERWFRGTYGNFPVEFDPLVDFDDAWKPEGRLHFTGSHVCGWLNGYTTGAYFAGEATAKSVLQRMDLFDGNVYEGNACFIDPTIEFQQRTKRTAHEQARALPRSVRRKWRNATDVDWNAYNALVALRRRDTESIDNDEL